MTLARALADAGEHRDPGIALDHGVNQLHHQDRFAHPGPAQHPGLAAMSERSQQVDNLDPGFEHAAARFALRQAGRRTMNRPSLRLRTERSETVDRIAHHVNQPSQHRLSDRHRNRRQRSPHGGAARQARGLVHCNGAHVAFIDMRLHLQRQALARRPTSRRALH